MTVAHSVYGEANLTRRRFLQGLADLAGRVTIFDRDNLNVMDWVAVGRVTKLRRL